MILKLFDDKWEECPYGETTFEDIKSAIKAHHLVNHKLPTYLVITEPHTEIMLKLVEFNCCMNFEFCSAVYRMSIDFLHVVTPSD